MNKSIVIIDVGSSSLRAILFDNQGTIINIERVCYEMTIENDKATQKPTDFSNAIIDVLKKTQIFADKHEIEIEAISITSQRSSVIVMDDKGPVLDALMWYDKRSQSICDCFNQKYGKMIKSISGSLATPVLMAPKIKFAMDELSESIPNNPYFASIHDYLIWFMSGEKVTDPTIGCRSNLMDLKKTEWSKELLELYGIEESTLSKLIPCGEIAGYITEKFAEQTNMRVGLPIITAGGDQQCSALGMLICDEKRVGMTLGSGGYVVRLVNSITSEIESNKSIFAIASSLNGKFNLEIGINQIGTLFNWCISKMEGKKGTPISFIDKAQKASNDKELDINYVMLLKMMMANEEVPNEWLEESKQSIVANAIIKSIIGKVCEQYDLICEEKCDIYIAGGLAKSDYICQMVSNITGAVVYRNSLMETTALGAWIIAEKKLRNETSVKDVINKYEKNHQGDLISIFKPNI